MSETIDETVARLAQEQELSKGGVEAALAALRRGGGAMAQFSHPDFGGMAQWTPGMSMVGEMFNDRLRAKLDAVCSGLTDALRSAPRGSRDTGPADDGETTTAPSGGWWPDGLGLPSATGAQNAMRYAAFPESRRLVVDDNGTVRIYDTGEHRIHGVSQAQSSTQDLRFVSQLGEVGPNDLKVVER